MKKIRELGVAYANTYKDCFGIEATTKWVKMFAVRRWENTVTEVELTEEERCNDKYRDIFIREFNKEIQRLISERPKKIIKEDTPTKPKTVKRKSK